jgi:hypothetical protein
MVRVCAQPLAERVAGVVAIMPVPVPVVGDPERDGLVVTRPQVRDDLRAGRLAARDRASSQAWCASRRMSITSVAQDCRLPGPSLLTARQRRMTCWLCRYRHLLQDPCHTSPVRA